MKSTNIQFKILYALGIFFIVSGHYANGGMSFFYEWFKPYAFHLGLFVFCSGYFYKAENEECIGKYVIGRIKKFIIPLYLWNLFYGLLVLFINMLGGKLPRNLCDISFGRYGRNLAGNTGVLYGMDACAE